MEFSCKNDEDPGHKAGVLPHSRAQICQSQPPPPLEDDPESHPEDPESYELPEESPYDPESEAIVPVSTYTHAGTVSPRCRAARFSASVGRRVLRRTMFRSSPCW